MRRRLVSLSALAVVVVTLVAVLGTIDAAFADHQPSTLEKVTKQGQLRVGWAPWYPFEYVDPKTQKLSGFGVDFYEQMAEALGVKLVWVEHPWRTIIAALQAGTIDIVSQANRTLPRILVAEYGGPITVTAKALMGRKDKVNRWKSWQDADNPNTSICVEVGTAGDTAVTKMFPKARIQRVSGELCMQAVAAGRADLHSTDIGVLIAWTKEHPDFVIVPNSMYIKQELGVFVKQGDQIFLNWVNQFIREMKLNGTIEELIKKYKLEGFEVAW